MPEKTIMNKQPSSRYCFVCGKQNPVGLKMEWFNDPERGEIRAQLTVPEHFNGYPGVVHGGIVAAILDETAGRAIMLSGDHENLMVTFKLEVTYKKPTPTGVKLTAVGRVKRETAKRAAVEGELLLPDGTVTATCAALIMKPPEEVARVWEREKSFWKVY